MTLDVQETCERYFLWEVATWSQPLERSAIESLQYNVCNFWVYCISVPGDWLHDEATIWENTVIQSFSLVWKWRIHTVLRPCRVQHSRECIQSLRRCWWVTRTQSPATDTREPCSWKLQGGIRAQKLLWGPGIVVSLRAVLCRHMQAYCRTSEHDMEPVSWNFITACELECFIWAGAAQKHICAEVWDCVSFTAWLLALFVIARNVIEGYLVPAASCLHKLHKSD